MLSPNVRYRMVVRVTGTATRGLWRSGQTRGEVWRQGDGFVADSPAFLANEHAQVYPTMQAAAEAAYKREVLIAPLLADIARFFPGVAAALMIDGIGPMEEPSPGNGARPANLASWERRAVQTARMFRRWKLIVKDIERRETWLFAFAGDHVVVQMYPDGDRANRTCWIVRDGMKVRAS